MTREEAVKIIRKYECNSDHYKACEMAIKSLEAWDEVMKDVQDWQDDFNGHIECLRLTDAEKDATMMYGEDVVNILGNHMAELKEVEE